MKIKKYRKLERWKNLIKTALCVSLLLPSVYLMKSYAAEVPSFFTVDSIMQEGIEDRNFAEAIYESIEWDIIQDNYSIQDDWDVKTIIENYSDPYLKGNKAIIDAVGKNIKSIEGITLFKNEVEIYLEDNEIHDHQLDDHRGSPDYGQEEIADEIADP